MRLATWNVDSVRARMSRIEAWLDRASPDVLCLQETKVGQRLFPAQPFVERGYEVATTGGESGQGGVALLARPGLAEVTLGIPGARIPLAEQRSISADVAGLRIHTAYVPNGRKTGTRPHAVKLAWFELFSTWVSIDGLSQERPTVVAGDLNVAPTDLDVWDPTRYRNRNLTSRAERQAFSDLLDRGLVDVVRQWAGTEPTYTWWNRRGDFFAADRGWRLDHVLADRDTAQRVSGIEVDRAERGRQGSSDHAPVVVDLVDG